MRSDGVVKSVEGGGAARKNPVKRGLDAHSGAIGQQAAQVRACNVDQLTISDILVHGPPLPT